MAQIGRNDPCPCSSGKKYKKCCLLNDSENRSNIPAKVRKEFSENVKERFGDDVKVGYGVNEIKMSEVILEFAKEIMERAGNIKQQMTAVSTAIIAWNMSFFDRQGREDFIKKSLDDMGINDELGIQDFREVMNYLLERKDRFYSHINRMIAHYDLKNIGGNVSLQVASMKATDQCKT